MSSKRFVSKISVKLMFGAGFFLLAFIMFQLIIAIGLGTIGKKSASYQLEQKRIYSFIHGVMAAKVDLLQEYQSSIRNQDSESASGSTLNTTVLSKVLSTESSKNGFSDMPDYFQKSVSEITSLVRQIGSKPLSSESASIEIIGALNKIDQCIAGLINQEIVASESFGAVMVASQNKIRTTVILWMSLIFLAAFVIYYLIIRSIRIKVQKTLRFAEMIASGNLAVIAEVSSDDEIGQIYDALDTLKEKLREVLNSIKNISMNIMNASAEFNSGSQLISGGASSQASSSEEISAAMEQIAEMIRQSTDNASETGKIAKNAFEGIQNGASHVESALAVIEDIVQKNSIIGEISYQTKILSINASVEASRAAEIGRGFAVVAEEVKRLAESTQSSASEITRVSKKGVDLARKSANELRSLVSEFKRTSELVTQIAEAGTEHINTIVQINYSLQDLNNITQQNASSAEELAASSDELVKLTHSLDELISFFKLEEDAPAYTPSIDEDSIEEKFSDEKDRFEKWDLLSFNREEPNQVVEEVSSFNFERVDDKQDEQDLSVLRKEILESKSVEEIVQPVDVKKPIKAKVQEEKAKVHHKGVRINLTDNDDLDSQFEKLK
jgi:methyl-accepting chemotaxis protein